MEKNKHIEEYKKYRAKIEKYNPIIARFMGYTVKSNASTTTTNFNGLSYTYSKDGWTTDEVDYHKNDGEMLQVLKKIESDHGCVVEIWMSLGKGCRIHKVGGKNEESKDFISESNDLLEAMYDVATLFIDWYNEEKEK